MFKQKAASRAVVAAALTVFASLPLAAHADNLYVGAGVGQSHIKLDDLSGLSTTSRDDKDTAVKIFGGYQLTNNFGLEIGYVDFGKVHGTYFYSPTQTSVNVEGKADSTYAALTGALPLDEQFSVTGKLGIAFNHGSISASALGASASASGNKTDGLIGVGLRYQINKSLAVGVEYENYGKVASDIKVDAVNVNLRLGF